MKTIWLLRHGETEFNVEGRLQGSSDSPLTANGHAQIQSVAKFFLDKGLEAAFSSDLLRARITAENIIKGLNGLTLNTSELLRERSFGVYEGGSFEDYKKQVGSKHNTLEFKPELGESLSEVSKRALDALQLIKASPAKNLLVVGHGGFNRCFLTIACDLPIQNIFEIKQANCCVNKLSEQPNRKLKLELMNFTDY